MAETFYSVLGVESDAPATAIRNAYRQAVKDCHPDVSDDPDADVRFKRLTTAKEVLVDDDERARYDRLGHEAYVETHISGDFWGIDPERTTDHATTAAQKWRHTEDRKEPTATDRATANTQTTRNRYSRTTGNRQSTAETTGNERREHDSEDAEQTQSGAEWWNDYESRAAGNATSRARQRQQRAKERARWSAQTGQTTRGRKTTTSHEQPDGPSWVSSTSRVSTDYYRMAHSHSPRERSYFDGVPGRIGDFLLDVGPWVIVHLVFLATVAATTGALYLLAAGSSISVLVLFVSFCIFGLSLLFSVLHIVSLIYT